MVGFNDLIKKSFLPSQAGGLSMEGILISLCIASFLSIYLFLIYRLMTRRAFYQKQFNISLVALAIITTAIILSIQSNLVISLGMVGALSIVRFRTAIKEPMDLIFLFWSISIGIICGAGLYDIAVIASVLLTVLLLLLERIPTAKPSMMIIVESEKTEGEEEIMGVIEEYCIHAKVRSRNLGYNRLSLVVEIRGKQEAELLQDLHKLEGVSTVSIVAQESDLSY